MDTFFCSLLTFLINLLHIRVAPHILHRAPAALAAEAKLNPATGLVETGNFFEGNVELLFCIVTLGLSFVIGVLVRRNIRYKKREEHLSQQLIRQELLFKFMVEAEGKDREQLVYFLQDVIGQQLSAAKLNITALLSFSKTLNNADKITIQRAMDLIDSTVKEVRNRAYNIIPNTLIKSGLVPALAEMIHDARSKGNVKINLEIYGVINRQTRPRELTLYRIMRELMNNCLAHSKAMEINIQVIKHEKELNILVQDNGVGFTVETEMNKNKGTGLKSIQSWVTFFNGKVFFDSQPTKGTTISIDIPE